MKPKSADSVTVRVVFSDETIFRTAHWLFASKFLFLNLFFNRCSSLLSFGGFQLYFRSSANHLFLCYDCFFLPRARIKIGCVIISSTFKLKISFEYILKYLNGSQNRDVVVSFATVQDQTCFDCFFLLSSAVVAGPTHWFWNWMGLVMFIDTVQWIEIGPRGRPPFLLMECLFGWWNLKADPLWLMKSIGSEPPHFERGVLL